MNIVELHFYETNFEFRYPDRVETTVVGSDLTEVNDKLFEKVRRCCQDNDFPQEIIRDGQHHSAADNHVISSADEANDPLYLIAEVRRPTPDHPLAKVLTDDESIYWYVVR